ncbi:ABC-type tungstate transport system, periplasmic component [Methanocella conradii HZ254]|uniref:ABC-type tungstate transport system, periplasmic component n=1 Tax=Methanocella conradii (strain DSM 24694 / JCM 17849 / CGMCC 1.5162 / HZ254) TaxID=1041930 RepID=H8I8D2_METCZ|nr:ABC transporter permease [Methanocella conradii]AFC98985.1 ABC-type tungstate transport system, periplasmic component [Methanocella conradii HZ254]
MGVIIDGFIQAMLLIVSLDPEIIDIASLSLKVSGASTLLASAMGIPLGAFIALNEFPLKRLLKNIIYTLMGLPPVVAGLLVFLMVSRAGPLGTYGLLFTPTAMVIAQVLLILPIITGLTITATRAVDRAIIDTAISMGAGRLHTALITLNEARQALIVAVLAGFGRAVAEVGAVMIVGGDIRWSTRVLTTSIVLETRMGDYTMAIALGTILLSLSFVINMALNLLQGER